MRRSKFLKKCLLSASVLFAGGAVFGSGCANTLASINLCGTVFTFCTPVDQVNLLFPMLDIPDFDVDPSCTIPLGCGDGGVLPPLVGGPGGDPAAPAQPAQGSGLGTGGGGGGGI